jgi:putative methyltransferase (TIGR04325 family)
MHAVKSLVPPIVMNVLRRISSGIRKDTIRFTGDFASWEDAERASSGYGSPIILERTRSALLKVRDNEAAYERDSVVFQSMEYPFPLIAALFRAAATRGGRLSVLDFGGSLGTTYFQCRRFLEPLKELRWGIVEQPSHVSCGRRDFESKELHFYESIDDCMRVERPDLLLLAGVVQYLPDPYSFIADVVDRGFEYIVADRTGFLRAGRDRLTLQHVPEWIYPAVYPCWFLSETRFLAGFDRKYDLLSDFSDSDAHHPAGDEGYFKGFIFTRKPAR